jgi:hypothetical protein
MDKSPCGRRRTSPCPYCLLRTLSTQQWPSFLWETCLRSSLPFQPVRNQAVKRGGRARRESRGGPNRSAREDGVDHPWHQAIDTAAKGSTSNSRRKEWNLKNPRAWLEERYRVYLDVIGTEVSHCGNRVGGSHWHLRNLWIGWLRLGGIILTIN